MLGNAASGAQTVKNVDAVFAGTLFIVLCFEPLQSMNFLSDYQQTFKLLAPVL